MKENFEGKIKLSIVIPVYNVEDTIERAVESIFLNDFKNIEVLLIDDGSTDNSGLICDELSKSWIKFIVIIKIMAAYPLQETMG